MKGFDELQRSLKELQLAIQALDGTICEISVDPNDPQSVDAAIAHMSKLVDERVHPFLGNPIVANIVEQTKAAYAQQIRERVTERHMLQDRLSAEAVSSFNQGAVAPEMQAVNAKPRVFISHTSADKERLVRPLDELLRARGIDTWLDERDLLPGHNLVDEIFSRGISESDAFIVVLSANSISRRWVHEELSVAVVHRIAGIVKRIIPLVVDGVTPPPALAATVWETVSDVSRLEPHADRIASSIIGARPAPVAPEPEYAGLAIHGLSNLSANDERLFAAACQQMLEQDHYYPIVSIPQVVAYAESIGMTMDDIAASLAALEQHYYFKDSIYSLGQQWPVATRISYSGFERYLESYRPIQYREAKIAVLSAIVNHHQHSQSAIAQQYRIHEALVAHIFEALERAGHAAVSRHSGGATLRAKPTMRRLLENMQPTPTMIESRRLHTDHTETFIASVQYGDWRGSAKADDIDIQLQSLQRYMHERRLLDDDGFLVGFRMFNGENGRFVPDETARVAPAYVTAYILPVKNYEEAREYLGLHNPIPVKAVRFEMQVHDFAMLFKRFSVALASTDLPLNGREIQVTEEIDAYNP